MPMYGSLFCKELFGAELDLRNSDTDTEQAETDSKKKTCDFWLGSDRLSNRYSLLLSTGCESKLEVLLYSYNCCNGQPAK